MPSDATFANLVYHHAKTKKKRVSISFTEDELYLLDNGFGTSYMPDETDADNRKLARISRKLQKAMEKFR